MSINQLTSFSDNTSANLNISCNSFLSELASVTQLISDQLDCTTINAGTVNCTTINADNLPSGGGGSKSSVYTRGVTAINTGVYLASGVEFLGLAGYDVGTGLFTCVEDGQYRFEMISTISCGATDSLSIKFRKNGNTNTLDYTTLYVNATETLNQSSSCVLNLVVGDTIDIFSTYASGSESAMVSLIFTITQY